MFNLEVNAQGDVLQPQLHDGTVHALLYEEEGAVLRIICRSYDAEWIEIFCRGVAHFVCDDWRKENIVGSLFLYDGEDVRAADYVTWVVGGPTTSYRGHCVFVIDSSDGGTVGVVCENVAWRRTEGGRPSALACL
jgi:hypothetical protein